MSFDSKYKMASEESLRNFTKQFSDKLRAYTAEGLSDTMDEILDLVHESADKYVPEDTKRTKKSWFQRVSIEDGKVVGYFGHDEEGQYDYIPFIYLGVNPAGEPINFRKAGARPFWLQPALDENLNDIQRKLSGSGKNK